MNWASTWSDQLPRSSRALQLLKTGSCPVDLLSPWKTLFGARLTRQLSTTDLDPKGNNNKTDLIRSYKFSFNKYIFTICCVRHCSRCLEISLNQTDKVLTLMELIFCGRGERENKQVNHVISGSGNHCEEKQSRIWG